MRLIGPHVSIRENIALSVARAHSIGATGFAIFTKNQRVWSSPPLSDADAEGFRSAMEADGYTPSAVLPHAGYLINPATPDEELWRKSLSLFLDEAGRASMLGLTVINIHPGAYREGTAEEGIRRAAAMFSAVLDSIPGIRIAIENTAGAGTILGSSFEELDALLEASRASERIGFTLDTAHLYGSDYDVKEDPEGILDSFVRRFGKERLFGMHLNDSKVPLSSRKDRHSSIGEGYIGKEAFYAIVRHHATEGIPLILETPDESRWPEEISMLLSTSEA